MIQYNFIIAAHKIICKNSSYIWIFLNDGYIMVFDKHNVHVKESDYFALIKAV
jgi:hypothetical protein